MGKRARLREISITGQALVVAVTGLSKRVDQLDARLGEIAGAAVEQGARLRTTMDALQTIHDREAANRLRVVELRRSSEYELAYTERDPLVTVVIPTYTNLDMLLERSIPSALGQTHPNVEVVVVGDAAPPEVGEAVASIGDQRVRFHNLPVRGPYPDDPRRSWLATGTPPYNLGVAEARGRWIAPLGDDDSFTTDHVERLLADARERRLELVYGVLRENHPDGTHQLIGAFPPELGQFGLQGSLLHSGLRFMEMQLSDVLFDLPNDFALCRRMLRAGVFIGMLDAVVCDYYPSRLWGERASIETPAPPTALAPDARSPDGAPPGSEDPEAQLRRYVTSLEAQLAAVRASKSWRWTSPMRQAARRARRRSA